METLLIVAGIVMFSIAAGFVVTGTKSKSSEKEASRLEHKVTDEQKLIAVRKDAMREEREIQKQIKIGMKQLSNLSAGIKLYEEISETLFKRDMRYCSHLLDYIRFKHVDIAHETALRIHAHRAKDISLRTMGTESQILELYEMEVTSKASDYSMAWNSFNSLLIKPRVERLFKVLHQTHMIFFTVEREKAKEFAQGHFDQSDAEALMFFYDNQDLFLRYVSYFSQNSKILHLLNSVPDATRFQLIEFLVDDTKILRTSAKKISTSLSMNIVDDFITASKLARVKEEN